MRRVGLVLVAAVLATGGGVGAEPNRAAADHPSKAARVKARAKPVAKAERVKPFAIPASALLVQYQRVGRELLLVTNERRAQIGVETEDAKLSCAELQATFRSIKIDDAVKTPESRAAAAAVLQELHGKIERLRGVALSQDCLNNPLANECT